MMETLVHIFLNCSFDYCSSILTGVKTTAEDADIQDAGSLQEQEELQTILLCCVKYTLAISDPAKDHDAEIHSLID